MPLLAHLLICAALGVVTAFAVRSLATRRAARAALAADRRYAALVDNLPNATVTVFDANLRVVTAGGDLERFGWSADKLVGRTLHELAPTRVAELEPYYAAALGGEFQQFDWVATLGAQPVEVRLVPLRDHHGRVSGILALSQDVSARLHAELAIRSSAERNRKLLEALPGTIVATFDEDLTYTFVGGTGLEDGGWTAEEYVGRTVYAHLPPETADSIAEHFRASLAGASRAFDHHAENGRAYRMRTVPLHDDNDGIVGGLVVMQDMTDHRAAEERLRESERRLREIFGALQEGISVHDATGAVVSRNASAERILAMDGPAGYPHLGDATWYAIDENGTRLADDELPVMEALRTGERVARVVGFVPPMGVTRWISTNCVPLFREGDTEPYAAVVSFTDVSAAREAERLKDEFFTLISHELRTPLTSIAGYTEMLLDEEDEQLTDTQRRFAEVVDRNAGRLQRLITDLLFVAQLEAGRLSFDVAKVQLDTVVRQAVDSARSHASDMAIDLDVNITEATTRGDFDRLGQVVDNLISNAIKFTPSGGHVAIDLAVEGGEAVVSVHDSGIGIPEPEIGDLFAKFVRASTAREREIPGVGIGLSICKAIVEGHGGSIHIVSAVGHGTTATVRLPLAHAEREAPAPLSAASGSR